MSAAEKIAEALEGVKTGTGWQCRCPAHDDSTPSMHVSETADGKVLVKCHAGCPQVAVIEALKGRGLWTSAPPRGCKLADIAAAKQLPEDALRAAGWRDSLVRGVPAIEISYRSKEGAILATQYRVAVDGERRFEFKRGDSVKQLYGLERWNPEETSTLLVEGTTDVVTARLYGQNVLGLAAASAWNEREHAAILDKVNVIFFIEEPDNGGKKLRAELAKSRIREKIRAVQLGEWKDLNELHCADPKQFEARLTAALRRAERLQPIGASVVCLADVEEKELEWLTRGGIDIPLGKITLIAGDPGVSKSTLSCDLAAAVTHGESRGPWANTLSGEVLMLSAEDDTADTIKPRLRIAGADMKRVHVLEAVRDYDPEGNVILRGFNLQNDIVRLAEVLRENRNIRLVEIDPISAYLGGVDSHVNADVRAVLAPLAEVAARERVAVLLISHLNKGSSNSINILYRVMGSLAFIAAARASFAVARDPEDRERRLLLSLKQNLTKESDGFAYAVEDVGGIPRIAWETEPVTITTDEALGAHKRERDKEVEDWLHERLSKGAVEAAVMLTEGKELGFSENRIKRVRSELGIRPYKENREDGKPAWWWALPVPSAEATSSRKKRAGKWDPRPEDWALLNVLAVHVVKEIRGPVQASDVAKVAAAHSITVPLDPEHPDKGTPWRIGGVLHRCVKEGPPVKWSGANGVGPVFGLVARVGDGSPARFHFWEGNGERPTDAVI